MAYETMSTFCVLFLHRPSAYIPELFLFAYLLIRSRRNAPQYREGLTNNVACKLNKGSWSAPITKNQPTFLVYRIAFSTCSNDEQH